MAESPESKQDDNPIVRTVNRLLRLMGVTFPKDVPVPKQTGKRPLNNFTYKELRHVTGFDKNYNSSTLNTSNMGEYIQAVAQQARSWAKESRNLRILAPEIDTARDVVVSTILSPTDLQTDNISVVVTNTGLGEELEATISKELQDFFNDEFKIGEKASLWIGDALYAQGAAAILLLPEKNLDIVNASIDLDLLKSGVDPNDHIVTPKSNKIGLDGSAKISSEGILSSCEALMNFESDKLSDIIETVSNEALDVFKSYESFEVMQNSKEAVDAAGTIKTTTSKIAELIADNKNYIRFSSDPTMLKATSNRLTDRAAALTKQIENNFLFGDMCPTYLVDTQRSFGKEELAISIRLPYQSVVPVIVPNSPETHVGYFILTDQWATPLGEDYYDSTASGGGKKLSESGMQAVFGKPNSSALGNLVTENNEFETASTIFGIMLRHMMDAKLDQFGLTGATVSYKETVSACVFQQLLNKKRVGVIFVPEPLMLYLRYDHNENGTGKSLIQDSNILIALRNTLVIAGVMAAAENSIDKKKIEVSVDEKNTNIEQTLNMVRNAFVEKNMLRFDNNPHTIQRDLVQKSMTIYPKGVKGLADSLNVQTDRNSTNSVEPNEALITKLTEWLIMQLIVPASAISKTGEDEYSRSVATTNLFFNNKIRLLQSKTTTSLTKFLRLYIYYSGTLRTKIQRILEESDLKAKTKRAVQYGSTQALKVEDDDVEEEPREHTIIKPVVKKEVKTNTDSISKNVDKIINNVAISLPAPRIVVDKAHFEEIQGYINTLDTILQAVYSDETTMELDGYSPPLKMLRAIIKEEMIRSYVKSIGFQSSYVMPPLTDISSSTIEENMLHLINVKKGVQDISEHIGKKVIKSDSFGNDSSNAYGNESGFGEESSSGFDEEGGGFGEEEPQNEDALNTEPVANQPEETQETEKDEASKEPTKNTSMPGGSLT